MLAAGLLIGSRPAAAHTDLEASSPADGETVSEAVATVTLDFSAAVTPVQDGYQVLDPQGQIRTPDAVEQPASDQILLRFDAPLAGGDVGVLWTVTAADGHLIEGGLSFTVDAPAPTTVASTTTAPATTAPTTTTTAPPTTTTARPPSSTVDDTVPAATDAPPTTAPPAATVPDTVAPTTVVPTTTPPITLEEFLGRSMSSPSEMTWRRVAQVVGVLGSLLAVGWLAFATVLAPRRPIARGVLTGAMVAGVVVSAAAVFEATTQAGLILDRGLGLITDPVTVYDTLGGDYRIALVLRLVGGLVLATGAAALRIRTGRGPLAAAGLGAAAVVASFTFDGHTVSKGNRVVQFVADIVHVLAGAWWLAGVVALVWWAWRRWRIPVDDGSDDGFLLALLRFSSYGGWALLALTLAGVVMTLGIIDGLGDLTATTWGRVLLFKLAATALAVAIAAYHRWALIPAVRDAPDDPVVRERVTDALAAEAFLLVLAAVLAGVLVGSQV